MSDKPKERKSGWYVVNFDDGAKEIYKWSLADERFYPGNHKESDIPKHKGTINETEIFDQLKEADEMREKIEEAKEIIKGLNVIIHALTHTDCPMLERKDIEDVARAAKQFI